MSNVRQLIEQLAATEEQRQFARSAERFGDDLERAWSESEDGAGLLWLATTVGVDPKQIVATACQLLEGVVEQINTTSQETTQILERNGQKRYHRGSYRKRGIAMTPDMLRLSLIRLNRLYDAKKSLLTYKADNTSTAERLYNELNQDIENEFPGFSVKRVDIRHVEDSQNSVVNWVHVLAPHFV